jgi:threonine/homoserine/homoserine lactone efflux protein
MPLDLWLAFVAASFVLLILPGPTVVLVLSYAASQGRRVALAVVAGVALGDLIAMTASLAGLGAVVMASATLFTALKWIGALYLAWMGFKLIGASGKITKGLAAEETTGMPARAVFAHAATVTALNPKSIAFFIAFFIAFVPQFLRPETPLVPQFAALIATFVTMAALNALSYALIADKMGARLREPKALIWLNRTGGTALIGMGAVNALMRRA